MADNAARRRRTLLGSVVLAAITVVAYLPALRAGYVLDDEVLLTDNVNVRSWAGLERTWLDPKANIDYYPLTFTSWAVEYQFWGLAPLGYHLDNILLHALNAVLVWLILRRLAVPGAWVAAAIFALHPVQVESVAWVAERKNVLSGLFCLLAVWAFLRAALPRADQPAIALVQAGESSAGRRRIFYALSLACFVLAMLAKPLTMAVAAVLPLLVWWKRGRLTWRDAAAVAPYFVLAAPMAALTIWIQYTHAGATTAACQHTLPERVIIAGRALAFYAGKLAWPADLCFAYPKWPIDAGDPWQYLYPAGVAAVFAGLWLLRRRLGVAPLVGAAAFAVMHSPGLGFINVYWHVYYYVVDHMQYLAGVGLVALGVGAAALAAARLGRWGVRAGLGLAAVVLGLLAVLTWQQCTLYKDAETIWRDTLRKNPDSSIAHNNLGMILREQGRVEEAAVEFEEALRRDPSNAKAHNNLALILADGGRLDEAVAHCREAIRLEPDKPVAYVSLALALFSQHRVEEAIAACRESLRLEPASARVENTLASCLLAQNQPGEAIVHYRNAIRLTPDYANAHYNLATVLLRLGRFDSAVPEFEEALRIRPEDADTHRGLAGALAAQGRSEEAATHLAEALRLRPDWPSALKLMAWIRATAAESRLRNGAEAIRLAGRACQLTGGKDADALDALAAAYAEVGRFDEAVRAARDAAALARAQGRTDAAAQIDLRVKLYESGRPYHVTPTSAQ